MTIEFQPWHIYRGMGPEAARPTFQIPEAPPWRRFSRQRIQDLGST